MFGIKHKKSLSSRIMRNGVGKPGREEVGSDGRRPQRWDCGMCLLIEEAPGFKGTIISFSSFVCLHTVGWVSYREITQSLPILQSLIMSSLRYNK